MTARRLAVLIDAENMPAKYAEAIFEELATHGEVTVRRVYGDMLEGSTKPWHDKLAGLAIAPFHQPKNTVGKNASDIALVIDAMDMMHTGRLDGFVIVSSDGDFTKLAQRLREHGLDVFGVGERKTPEAFRMACKQFITVENLGIGAPSQSGSEAEATKSLNHAYQLIGNVIGETNDPEGWARLAWVGAELVKRYPDFDSRSYGHRRLGDLVRAIGKFEEGGEGANLRVRQKP